MMEIKIWESSTVHLTEYNSENQTLKVEFKNGNIYEYYKVPLNVWESLLEADSIGKYLNTHIKGAYDYKKL